MHLEWIFRVILGGILGGCIGIERKRRFKDAGFRTHFLVGLGSALIMVVSRYGFMDSSVPVDPSRLAAQVVSGIGFLGAGTILTNKGNVTGLTTAAGLWVTSAIGLTIGSGMYLLAISVVILVLIGLEYPRINLWLKRRRSIELIIGLSDNGLGEIAEYFRKKKIYIISYEYIYLEGMKTKYELKIVISISVKIPIEEVLQILQSIEYVDYIKNE